MACRLLVFTATMVARLLLFKAYHGPEEKGVRLGQNATKLTVLTEIQLFFLNNYSLDFCKPLVLGDQKKKKKVDFYSFCQNSP